MKLAAGYLTYCTNIHAGETWAAHFEALQNNFPAIKQKLSPGAPMGIGLRLSNIASTDILKDSQLTLFQQWLQDNDSYVFTMNGFPYGGFHNTRVKDQVHAPDWLTADRLNYTIRLFDILAQLLPKGMDGGISTSPLTYRHWYTTSAESEKAMEGATKNIIAVAAHLHKIFQANGKLLHLDIEPEPDGLLETGQEFMDWFEGHLIPQGKKQLAQSLGVSGNEAETILKRHIQLCYDVCHFAIGYEPHQQVINQLAEKGIKVGKIQISAALKAILPQALNERKPVIEAIAKYNEPTYLHQVIAKTNNGELIRYPDLPEALAAAGNTEATEWRAHFHVPIFIEEMGLIQSTQSDIVEVLNIQKAKPFTSHLEVETYTWEVLPDELKVPIGESIIRELEWVMERIKI